MAGGVHLRGRHQLAHAGVYLPGVRPARHLRPRGLGYWHHAGGFDDLGAGGATVRAYYNEIEPFAVAWLKALMAAGEIPNGDVDERSIELVRPGDLDGFDQCHFFAGIGGWAYALRLAGWPEDEPIWTGSCPCQPFSAAGQRRGTDDPRHLWPHFHRLIALGGPPVVAGEQVASADGREWLAGVRVDLEALGYAVGAADLCSAGAGAPDITLGDCAAEAIRGIRAALDSFGEIGSAAEIAWAVDRVARTVVGPPHIRQRLFWVGESTKGRRGQGRPSEALLGQESRGTTERPGFARGLGQPDGYGCPEGQQAAEAMGYGHSTEPASGADRWLGQPMQPGLSPSERAPVLGAGRRDEGGAACEPGGAPVWMDDATNSRRPGERERGSNHEARDNARVPEPPGRGTFGGLGHPASGGCRIGGHEALARSGRYPVSASWSRFGIVECRDGKARRFEPESFPLVAGLPGRVGRLRGYGNAIVPQVAAEFVRAYREARGLA